MTRKKRARFTLVVMPYRIMGKYKNIFLWLHVAWLLLWGLVLVFMLLPSSQAGHPPIIVFAIYPLMYGIEGHLLLLFIQFLYRVSNRAASRSTSTSTDSGWPWQVVLALVILASSAFSILIFIPLQFIGTVEGGMPAFMIPVVILKLVALYGLIVRTRWGYRLIQGLCLFLLVALLGLLVFYITDEHTATSVLVKLPIYIGLYAVYVYSFSTADKVKRFFCVIK